MKPSELIKSLSPKGYVDTELMYASEEPNVLEITNAYKAGIPVEVLDVLKHYNFIDLHSVESDMSLLKDIEHPGQIVGGYAFSPELASTIEAYFGREALLSTGRPVNLTRFYTKEEITSPLFLKAAINRENENYTSLKKFVGYNRNYSRDLEMAKKAYALKKLNTGDEVYKSYVNIVNGPSGSVIFTKDNILSLDALSIALSIYGEEIHSGNQIELEIPLDINVEYKRHRCGREPVPYNYAKASGRTIASLFDVCIEKEGEPDTWETMNTTSTYPIYIGKCEGEKVVTIIPLTNNEVLARLNKKVERINKLYERYYPPILLSSLGDFFYRTIYAVHC